MIDIKIIREDPERVRTSIEHRNLDPEQVNIDRLLELDQSWRQDQARVDELRNQRNSLSTSIKKLAGDERQATIDKVKGIKQELVDLEGRVTSLKEERDALLKRVPNLLAPDVPIGKTDADNVEIRRWGEVPAFGFEPRSHVELGQLTDTIDFERAAKVTGSNFYYLKHEAALLEIALLAYAQGLLADKGFTPLMTRSAMASAPGFRQSCGSTSHSTSCVPAASACSQTLPSRRPPGGRNHCGVTPVALCSPDCAVTISERTSSGEIPVSRA